MKRRVELIVVSNVSAHSSKVNRICYAKIGSAEQYVARTL